MEYGTIAANVIAKFNYLVLLLNRMEYRLECGNSDCEGGAQGHGMVTGVSERKERALERKQRSTRHPISAISW